MNLVTIATCNLRQWVLDFNGNTARIIESIKQAKRAGARVRIGPELEVCGYSCLDHFLENDIYTHSMYCLRKILENKECHGILLDIGMPIFHRNNRFNARVICLDGRILLIRPKLYLANDGNYREMRFFTPWARPRHCEDFKTPIELADLQGDAPIIIGDAVISTPDTCIGWESCEELWTVNPPHNIMALNGVEIISNSSGSHFTLRKLNQRVELIREATRRNSGCYVYSNQQGGDGERLYFDGTSMIFQNGALLAQASQFSLKEVEVATATIDLDEIRAKRFAPSSAQQATQVPEYRRIHIKWSLSSTQEALSMRRFPSPEIEPHYFRPEEEIGFTAGAYLWDYLRRSGTAGYLVPLSGGIDSCATATMVFGMCRMVKEACDAGEEQVIADVKRLCHGKVPDTPEAFCNKIFHTIFMGMSRQSSKETRQRAKDLSAAIGSYHLDLDIDEVFNAQRNLIVKHLNFEPQFEGTKAQNLMLQNIQSRSRLVTAYEFAQILPETRGWSGALLVLGSANVGESLRGYLTKYDCSSADINPIGSIDKTDLKRFIKYAKDAYGIPCLQEFLDAVPTAELEPITETYVQSDEADMGFTYDELTTFGRLRKNGRLGPLGMFRRLVHEWGSDRPNPDDGPVYTPQEVAKKTKLFYHYYALNRHKMTTLTPSLHSNDYSPDDNRFDLRPFLYPPFYKDSLQFQMIDEELAKIESLEKETTRESGQ